MGLENIKSRQTWTKCKRVYRQTVKRQSPPFMTNFTRITIEDCTLWFVGVLNNSVNPSQGLMNLIRIFWVKKQPVTWQINSKNQQPLSFNND